MTVTRRLSRFFSASGACLIDVAGRRLVAYLLILAAVMAGSAVLGAAPPRMRPYTGIGLVVFSQSAGTQKQDFQLPLYDEPGLSRVGVLSGSGLSGNEWIFGVADGALPLIVSARKGDWVRVFFDDAGREAWINPENKGRFHSWEQFLKSKAGGMLPALSPQYYQLRQQPGGKQLATLTPRQTFKVLKIENAWALVLIENSQIGWVRWRDDDGRLLLGFSR